MKKHKGPQTPGQARPELQVALPPDLASVALVNAKTAATVGNMSVSWWHEKVAVGEAPQPVIRAPRCTRWRMIDVRDFWTAFAARGIDAQCAERVRAQANQASAAAKARTAQAKA